MEIDYKKLAFSNSLIAKWKLVLDSIQDESVKRDLKASYNLGYNKNFFYYVNFFKNHSNKASKILGSQFAKDKKKMFFAETVETELILQYRPAIYAEFRNKRITVDIREEIFQHCLIGLRESVWKYARSDIKFSTYAINGIRNNIGFYRSQRSDAKKKWDDVVTSFSQLTQSDSEPSFETCIEDKRDHDKCLPVFDFILSIAKDAALTKQHINEIKYYVAEKRTRKVDFGLLKTAKKRLVAFIEKNPHIVPEFDKLVG